MKKIVLAVMAMGMVLPAAAQDTYESGRTLGSDLNGTARYVGMGGAMDALGADISTMGTNPAGIGLFRHSTISGSFGFVSQQGANKFDGLSTTNMSFDQLGFVYAARVSRTSFINFGVNYHKSRNFDQILSAANRLNGASANGLTYNKAEKQYATAGGFDLGFYGKSDEVVGYESPTSDYRAFTYSQMDDLNANVLLLDAKEDNFYYADGEKYTFDRAHRGWIADFDLNISGNHNDRIYWGLTVGIHSVKYKGYSEYSEWLTSSSGLSLGAVSYGDERKINGTGYDIKAGLIFRPVEESPFRIGLAISTPTWYELTSENSTVIVNESEIGRWNNGENNESYKFQYSTPWKFGVSLGHTVGRSIALGAGYEYSDYGASKNKIIEGYDAYDVAQTSVDQLMKRNTEQALKGVHTLKAGIEFKPDPAFAIRFGYNYVSAAYNKEGVRDMTLNTPGVMYASTNDYTNWKDTHRVTCGLGYKAGPVNIDLAYQYNATNGDFHPMQNYGGYSPSVTSVSNKRHQALLTLGYTF